VRKVGSAGMSIPTPFRQSAIACKGVLVADRQAGHPPNDPYG
jgi:hypothetical protein